MALRKIPLAPFFKGGIFLFIGAIATSLFLFGCGFDYQSSGVCPGFVAGSLPNPTFSAGTVNTKIPVNHIIVLMQENHSFDNYFGRLSHPNYYGQEIDGSREGMSNPDIAGRSVAIFHQNDLCMADIDHSAAGMYMAWNGGKHDQFVRNMGVSAMSYYDQTDLPYYYELANQFAIADRYFSSFLGPTYPNRYFLLAGTAFGHVENDMPQSANDFAQKTIFDVLNQFNVSWKYYTDYRGEVDGQPGYLALFGPMASRNTSRIVSLSEYTQDIAQGKLPSVVFLDANETNHESEHPGLNIQIGQSWVSDRLHTLMNSPYWRDSVMFLVYDEGGGFYDHVPPPEACSPDNINPQAYTRYGFRVPFVAISPYAKRHYVSHQVYDHTSILKFIQTKFNLPALTIRDAAANDLLDLFDFSNPRFDLPQFPSTSKIRGCGSSSSS